MYVIQAPRYNLIRDAVRLTFKITFGNKGPTPPNSMDSNLWFKLDNDVVIEIDLIMIQPSNGL